MLNYALTLNDYIFYIKDRRLYEKSYPNLMLINEYCNNLYIYNDTLYVSTDTGIYKLTDLNEPVLVYTSEEPIFDFMVTDVFIYFCTKDGVVVHDYTTIIKQIQANNPKLFYKENKYYYTNDLTLQVPISCLYKTFRTVYKFNHPFNPLTSFSFKIKSVIINDIGNLDKLDSFLVNHLGELVPITSFKYTLIDNGVADLTLDFILTKYSNILYFMTNNYGKCTPITNKTQDDFINLDFIDNEIPSEFSYEGSTNYNISVEDLQLKILNKNNRNNLTITTKYNTIYLNFNTKKAIGTNNLKFHIQVTDFLYLCVDLLAGKHYIGHHPILDSNSIFTGTGYKVEGQFDKNDVVNSWAIKCSKLGVVSVFNGSYIAYNIPIIEPIFFKLTTFGSNNLEILSIYNMIIYQNNIDLKSLTKPFYYQDTQNDLSKIQKITVQEYPNHKFLNWFDLEGNTGYYTLQDLKMSYCCTINNFSISESNLGNSFLLSSNYGLTHFIEFNDQITNLRRYV